MEYRDETLQKGGVVAKTLRYLQRNGLKKTCYKLYRKVFRLEKIGYDQFRKQAEPTAEELRRQREEAFPDGPLISVLVPLYRTPTPFLAAMIDSVLHQTYAGFELCLADGSADHGATRVRVEEVLKERNVSDRVFYQELQENKGIAGNTNAALAMAHGNYLVLLDHDDVLAPNALYEMAKAIQENPEADFLYADEDKTDESGKTFFDPHFKPDFNPDLLQSMNYICHPVCVKAQLADLVGGFDEELNGAQDHDFIFRCTEKAQKIVHIPKVLYHWRSHGGSTAGNAESKRYAFEAGKRAIEAHLQRTGQKGEVIPGVDAGVYHVSYLRTVEPLVSVIIPNKDHVSDLKTCLESLFQQSYTNIEVIIVENNSTEPETFEYYEELAADSRIRVVRYEHPFNYSAVNNYGASFARGEYLLLLNNDVEWIAKDSLKEMVGYGLRPNTGIVGAKLLYGDNTIQHAGVIIGIGGMAGHAFQGLPRDERSYMYRAWCTQDYSAVTAACLLIRASVYQEIGGFEEKLAVAFNDVDLCLRVREMGYQVVYNSEALLYHYESKSRGQEDTPEKVERFNGETRFCMERWADVLRKGDPYYNPNLSLEWQGFSCKSRAGGKKAPVDKEALYATSR